MMNPYYYLFYRFNQFVNETGDNELGPMFGVSVIVALNLSVVFRKLLPMDIAKMIYETLVDNKFKLLT